jgi:uncharacterized protein
MRAFALILCLATPAFADVPKAVESVILPGYANFTKATAALAAMTDANCDAASLRPAWNAAFDAWLGVSFITIGPAETNGRSLAIAFWPDPKGTGARQQAAMIAAKDPAALDAASFAEVSVAARGLFGMERLLYPETPLTGDYPCTLIRATAADLAHMARAIEGDWQSDFATAVLTAGATSNTQYLSETEAKQALFTQLITGLEFVKGTRIGRPLGTFDKPTPDRAEAHLSARPQRNIVLSLMALRAYSAALAPDASQTLAAFDRAIATAQALPDPTLADITDPQAWLKLQILQQQVQAVDELAVTEVGKALNVGVGFNAADGD